MKKEILEFIHCPECQEKLDFQNYLEDDFEITQGKLLCQKCKNSFAVDKGMVFLYKNLTPEVEKEREALKREIHEKKNELSYQDESWLLDFPYNEQKGVDARSREITKLIIENILKSLKKFITGKNSSILEIGAGNCWLTAKLAENNYCIAFDMFDLPPKGIESGKVFIKNKRAYFERVVADMIKLPFKDSSFDFVVISSSLHHSSNLPKSISEIHRVLKPGGKLILFNEPSTGLMGGAEREQVKTDLKQGINENRYTITEWKNSIKKAGFKVKIYLPSNIIDILLSKKGIFRFAGILLSKLPKFILDIVLYSIAPPILKIFDGFFNAVATKKLS